jgi:hypothetical protein
LNQKGPDYKRPTITTETYDEGPLSGNDLLDLLPFQQFTINNYEEPVSTVPVSETNVILSFVSYTSLNITTLLTQDFRLVFIIDYRYVYDRRK